MCFCALAQEPADTPGPSSSSDPDALAALPSVASPAPFVATNFAARFDEYGSKLFGPSATLQTVPIALFDHVRDFPHEWGQEPRALFDRLGSEYGQFFLDQTIQLALWGVHREDSHYFRSGHGNFFSRTGHALKSTVIVSNTTGGQTLALGAIAGSYGSWAIATKWWEPKSEQNAQQLMLWGTTGLIGKAAANFFHEFWPDARRKFFRHSKPDPLAAWSRAADQ